MTNACLELPVVKAHFEDIRDVSQAILDDEMMDLYPRDEERMLTIDSRHEPPKCL